MRTNLLAAFAFQILLSISFGLSAFGADCVSSSASHPFENKDVIVLEGATLFDGTDSNPKDQTVVVVEGNCIQLVAHLGEVEYPKHAKIIDVRGLYLIPGLMDLHAHYALEGYDAEITRSILRALLTHGVTTILSPGGDTEFTLAVRESVHAGSTVGPRIFAAGDILYKQVSSPEDVRREVKRQAEAGVDWVKMYRSLTPEMTRVGVEEAHSQGVKAVAHTSATPWQDAAEAGIDLLVHAGPGISSLMTQEQREDYVAYGDQTQRFYIPFEWVDPREDTPEFKSLIEALKSNKVAVDPTLVVYESIFWWDSPRFSGQELRYVHPRLLEAWQNHLQMQGWAPEDYSRAKAAWPRALEFVRLLHKNGVLLVSGTDPSPAAVGVIPGASVHRNLELLVEAGIPSADVLRIATRNSAEALGILNEAGTVEQGKFADLVLLRGNPVENISNTQQIEWVMKSGVIYDPTTMMKSP